MCCRTADHELIFEVIMLMSGAMTVLLRLRGAVTAAICNAGGASNCEGAGSANLCVWSSFHQWLS